MYQKEDEVQQLRAQLKTATTSQAPQQRHAGAEDSTPSAAEDFFSVGGGGGSGLGSSGGFGFGSAGGFGGQAAVKPKLGEAPQDKAAGAAGSGECPCS